MKEINYILFSLIVFLLLTSCTDDQCNADTESLLKMEMVRVGTVNPSYYITLLSVYSPTWNDSIHYEEEGSKNSLYLKLNPSSDTTELILTSQNASLNDTLFIFSQREMLFLSPECGFVTNYSIDSIVSTSNYIDSLQIITKNISTEKDGSIKIYF